MWHRATPKSRAGRATTLRISGVMRARTAATASQSQSESPLSTR